jgi:hypothetical protein
MTNQEIATTILKQLGGNKFKVMTGAKNFAYGDSNLTFKIGRNSGKCNHVRVTLNSMDTYKMEFISVRGTTIKTVKEFNNVYCDQLQEIFTEVTGMYTSL